MGAAIVAAQTGPGSEWTFGLELEQPPCTHGEHHGPTWSAAPEAPRHQGGRARLSVRAGIPVIASRTSCRHVDGSRGQ